MAHTIILNCDFLDDPKLTPIIEALGEVQAGSFYVRLITMMAKQGGILPVEQVENLGRRLMVTKTDWKSFLALCLKHELIFQDGENYSCKRLKIDKENLEKKRERWREKKRIPKIKNGDSEVEVEQEQEQEVEKEKEVLIELSATASEALRLWTQYRKEIKKPLTPSGIKQILKSYEGKDSKFLTDVQHSIKSGWQGLFAASRNGDGKKSLEEELEEIARM